MEVKFKKPKKVCLTFDNAIQFDDGSILSLIRVAGIDRKPLSLEATKGFEVSNIKAIIVDSMQLIKVNLQDKEGNSLGFGIEIPNNSIYSLVYLRKKKFLPKESEVLTLNATVKI